MIQKLFGGDRVHLDIFSFSLFLDTPLSWIQSIKCYAVGKATAHAGWYQNILSKRGFGDLNYMYMYIGLTIKIVISKGLSL